MKLTKTSIYITLIGLGFLLPSFVVGQITYHVPADYSTIQAAIGIAISGDTIVVAPGTYVENIRFRGKDVYLTSEFLYTNDRASIENTIIDGSQPSDSDLASVIRIVSGETANAVVRGFTITNGRGTRTYNSQDNAYFRTGGGISVDHASPTIINNIIRNNECNASADVSGAGGGGLRVGFGRPYVANNLITENSGGYAGGIMIAYCEGMFLENNVISYNHSDGSFGGGGGVYVDWENINIINNSIVNNVSGGTGGGLCITGNTSIIKNCIIYGNQAISPATTSIRRRNSGNPQVSYTNIAGGWTSGTGNIDTSPMFIDEVLFEISASSPCVDAGDPDSQYNDQVDAEGNVLLPAKGGVRNDMGAYGGGGYTPAPEVVNAIETILEPMNFELSSKGESIFIKQNKRGYLYLSVFNTAGQLLEVLYEGTLEPGTHQFELLNAGFQLIIARDDQGRSQVIKNYK